MAYIPRKMRAIKAGDHYLITYKDVTVKSGTTIKIKASNMYFFLVEGFSDKFRIGSDSGVYDEADGALSEMMHEHTGEIVIENRSSGLVHLEFIVAIVRTIKKGKK